MDIFILLNVFETVVIRAGSVSLLSRYDLLKSRVNRVTYMFSWRRLGPRGQNLNPWIWMAGVQALPVPLFP